MKNIFRSCGALALLVSHLTGCGTMQALKQTVVEKNPAGLLLTPVAAFADTCHIVSLGTASDGATQAIWDGDSSYTLGEMWSGRSSSSSNAQNSTPEQPLQIIASSSQPANPNYGTASLSSSTISSQENVQSVQNTLGTWTATTSGSWDMPREIYLNPVTRQAQVPVTVNWYNKPPHAGDTNCITLDSDDPSLPVIGTVYVTVHPNDPPSGSKTSMMTVTGPRRQTTATATLRYSDRTGAFAGHGQDIEVTIYP